MRVVWRGEAPANVDSEVSVTPAHNSLDVLTAIKDASSELYEACTIANHKRGNEPNFVDKGGVKYFETSFCSINHMCDCSPGPFALGCTAAQSLPIDHTLGSKLALTQPQRYRYTALQLYAHRQRCFRNRSFKLKSIVLAGDLGGRGSIVRRPFGSAPRSEPPRAPSLFGSASGSGL